MKGISIESLFKYVENFNFDTFKNPNTIDAWMLIVRIFSKLKKAIERIIRKKDIIFISGFVFTKYESLCISK
jgi:hypothetical protein|tara:strand:+ start:2110 stop:2325 length:216 start_codon:yes stop_codon:yes gene_type:complete